MRTNRWLIILFTFICMMILSVTMVLAEDIEFDPNETYYEFNYQFSPHVNYNPVEKWRFGGSASLTGLAGPDVLEVLGVYSFYAHRLNSSFLYLYHFDNNMIYTNIIDNLEHEGVYGKEILWQRNQSISLGVSQEQFWSDDYYVADLMVKYLNREPVQNPDGLNFDTGKDLMIHPSIFGTYKGYLGNFDLVYGVPSDYSDYNYLRVNGMIKKAFEITNLDRIVLAAQGGYILGNYPLQQEFFLGSSQGNIFPNFKPKFQNLLSGNSGSAYQNPEVTLDGYWDHYFHGDKMYTVRVDYQRKLFKEDFDAVYEMPFYLVGKVYGVFGNAWSGDLQEGLDNVKPAIGIGFHVEPKSLKYFEDKELYAGFNLARGFGEEAATTFGVEIGTTFQFVNFMNF